MGEHTSLADRLIWIRGQIGEGSPHQAEEADAFVGSLGELGYTRWLSAVCEAQEVLSFRFAGADFARSDLKQWQQISEEAKAILFLAADVIEGNRPTEAQQTLLTDLQTETEPPNALDTKWYADLHRWDKASSLLDCSIEEAKAAFPNEARVVRDQELLIELHLAKAMDQARPITPREKPIEKKPEPKAPGHGPKTWA